MEHFDLIQYCIRQMGKAEKVKSFFDEMEIYYARSDGRPKLSQRINKESKIALADLRNFYRSKWTPAPTDFHIENLCSGVLKDHSWYGATPSYMHSLFQDKVRRLISTKGDINSLISIGTNVMKHEYFMVAVHDLSETELVKYFPDVIPTLQDKSISDFTFRNIPYDLKVTNTIQGKTSREINEIKSEVISHLYEKANIKRIRKQAKDTVNNWGANRFYLIVEDQDRWLSNPQDVLDELISEAKKLEEPFTVDIGDGVTIQSHLIAI